MVLWSPSIWSYMVFVPESTCMLPTYSSARAELADDAPLSSWHVAEVSAEINLEGRSGSAAISSGLV